MNGAGTAPSAPTPDALYEAGLGHMRAERYLDAQICCQQALAIDSSHADSLHLMGLLSFQAQQYDHAVEWIARAIRQNPRPEYLVSLGMTLRSQGRHQDALNTINKAVELRPDDAELWRHLGDALLDLKHPAEALLAFRRVLQLNPRHWIVAHKSGFLLHELGRFEEACAQFDLCDQLQPNHASTLQARALSLRSLNRLDQAMADYKSAHALDPDAAGTPCNIGEIVALSPRGEEAALHWFDKAIALQPDLIAALNSKAHVLLRLQRFEEFIATSDRIKAIDPDNVEAAIILGHFHLLTGNFEAGWIGQEARLRRPSSAYPKLPKPMWRGEGNIDGKTILIGPDEGLGDTIQFIRYVPMLAERGARVTLVVQDALYPLLCDLPGVSQCLPTSVTLPAFDFDLHCPISSLPFAFGTRLDTIPSAASYLPALPATVVQSWQDRLGVHDKPRVGLVWSGNPKHANDHNRSLPLHALTRLFDVDATFVSLQKDPGDADKATLLESADIVDMTAHLTDFTQTAALVTCLDLVITVDTSVAHLAAALGRPTWILLPFTPDYRWMLDRDDSPWYPGVRLFRQSRTRDYGEVLDRVREALLTFVSGE